MTGQESTVIYVIETYSWSFAAMHLRCVQTGTLGTIGIKWMITQVTRLLLEEYMLVEFKE